MMVKICGITNAQDARAAIDAGASALGFNFYSKSPRAVTPQTVKAIPVPASVLKVGVFVNEQTATIARTMIEASLDIAQVIGPAPANTRTWIVHRVSESFDLAQLDDPAAEAFLLDTPSDSLYGGTGHTFDWSRARTPSKRIIIAGGLGPENVAEAIRQARPWGVDACSRLETSPGRKDPLKVKAFIAAALSA